LTAGLVCLVHFVCLMRLVYLVYLVCLVFLHNYSGVQAEVFGTSTFGLNPFSLNTWFVTIRILFP
jgi:hypothetical protein